MAHTLDLTDVALVAPEAMLPPMQHMIDTGRGLVLLNGASAKELREVDQAVWEELDDDPVTRVAVLMRFRCLIEVFSFRRLQELLLQRGFNLLAPALHVAARMRLNAELGFNPAKFERALLDLLAQLEHRRSAPVEVQVPLYANP